MEQFDAVVVGSGPNGLAAANALCDRGWSVLMLEEKATAGGGLRTEDLTLPGFRHDTFSAVHPAAVASPVFRRWNLERFGVSWIHPPIALTHVLENGGSVSLHRSLAHTVESLNAARAGDGDRWASFVRPYLNSYPAVQATVLGGFPPMGGAARMLWRLGPQGVAEFLRVTLNSALTISEDLFEGDAARSWFFGLGMHSDVSVRLPGTAVMALHLALLGHAVGWPSPRGGAGSLATALMRRLEAAGGRIRTAAAAEELLISQGRVIGVRAGGDAIKAKAVLCATSPTQLLRLAGDSLSGEYEVRLRRFRQGFGVLKIDWALDEPIPWASADARKAGTVHVGADTVEMVEACDSLERGSFPAPPFLIIGQQSLADTTRAPKGFQTAWGYARVPPGQDAKALAVYADGMETQIERFAPGFRDRILARHVLTPERLEALNSTLHGGDIGGGSYALDQMLLRPLPALSPYRTPVRGLYLAGASTFPGGSVHGVCGWAAARCAFRDAREGRGWLRRARRA
jgi:phytoene dehydrogenase-like protein